MSTGTILLIILAAAALLLLVVWGVVTRNGLIASRNRVKQCQATLCKALGRRNGLIPRWMDLIRGRMADEEHLLTGIVALLARIATAPESVQVREGGELSTMLCWVNIAVENYPELASDEQVFRVRGELTEREAELQTLRRACNAAITDYNRAIGRFPASLIAILCRLERQELIELPESEDPPAHIVQLFRS